MKKVIKITTITVAIFVFILTLLISIFNIYFPNNYNVSKNSSNFNVQFDFISIKSQQTTQMAVKSNESASVQKGVLMFADIIPIKTVNINYEENTSLVACGTPFGIKMFTQGLVVVKTDTIVVDNKNFSPSIDAGIQNGDIITSVNGNQLFSNEELANAVNNSGGNPLTLSIVRNNKEIKTSITPIKTNEDKSYKIGLWVRDSSAGIGTVTYYDKETSSFAGLGHGVCDVDTGELLPLNVGEIVDIEITDVRKSQKGSAGSLNGYFASDEVIGSVTSNTHSGVFGYLETPPSDDDEIPIAYMQEIKIGNAEILSTISGDEPVYYDIEIEQINYDENNKTKNLVIKITDNDLISQTGGIVQGMSGSPIIQNGKIVGAVTHVFVNDPVRGYGIFIENMLESAENID